MDIKSLMIGDWVIPHIYDSKLEPSKIIGIYYNSYKGKDYVDWVDCEVWDEIGMDDIEPIPITPDILEKNGFKSQLPKNHLETVFAYQDVSKAVANDLYALWLHQDGSFYLLLRVNGKDMVRIDVRYVHQLQHALRLCGIEKEIKL